MSYDNHYCKSDLTYNVARELNLSDSTECHLICHTIPDDSGSESEQEEEVDFEGGDWEAMFAIDEEFFNRDGKHFYG